LNKKYNSDFSDRNNYKLKLKAGEELGKLISVLNEKDRGEKILTIVLKLAHDD
jgi:hypothetical protein